MGVSLSTDEATALGVSGEAEPDHEYWSQHFMSHKSYGNAPAHLHQAVAGSGPEVFISEDGFVNSTSPLDFMNEF